MTCLELPIISHDDVSLKEYVGFDYSDYIEAIKVFIDSSKFEQREFETFRYLPGTNEEDWERVVRTYKLKDTLTEEQIGKLRTLLKDAFDNGKSIRKITRDIIDKVKPGDETIIIKTMGGAEYTRKIPEQFRALLMARTETVRASNQGLLTTFADSGVVERVKWLSSVGERTCAYCEAQNGLILDLDEADEQIPAHSGCRCTWTAVID